MKILAATMVGLLAGVHTSTWGMYKDALHEGFELRKYLRSILIAAVIAAIISVVVHLDVTNIEHLLVLFGVTYVIERAATEFYKMFIRNEEQSKYAIPMQFAVFGRVVHSRRHRFLIGVVIAAVYLGVLLGVITLTQILGTPSLVGVVLLGSIGGWISAFGGAWKDAPFEGFDVVKFFRSPLWAAGYSFVLWNFTHNIALTALAALGFTIATLETYKKFFFPHKPAGKFEGKPIRFPHMLQLRKWFVPLYAGIWMLLVAAFAAALQSA